MCLILLNALQLTPDYVPDVGELGLLLTPGMVLMFLRVSCYHCWIPWTGKKGMSHIGAEFA